LRRIKSFLKKPNIIWNNKGLTLVEILVAMGLIVIVISLGFTLLFFGMRSFDTGTAQAHTQQNVRLVGDYMRSELRNAVEITASGSGTPFFEIDGDVFKHNGNAVTNDVKINEVTIYIDNSNGTAILKFEIDAQFEEESDKGSFTYEDQVLLNNLPYSSELETELDGHELSGGLYYNKPD